MYLGALLSIGLALSASASPAKVKKCRNTVSNGVQILCNTVVDHPDYDQIPFSGSVKTPHNCIVACAETQDCCAGFFFPDFRELAAANPKCFLLVKPSSIPSCAPKADYEVLTGGEATGLTSFISV